MSPWIELLCWDKSPLTLLKSAEGLVSVLHPSHQKSILILVEGGPLCLLTPLPPKTYPNWHGDTQPGLCHGGRTDSPFVLPQQLLFLPSSLFSVCALISLPCSAQDRDAWQLLRAGAGTGS